MRGFTETWRPTSSISAAPKHVRPCWCEPRHLKEHDLSPGDPASFLVRLAHSHLQEPSVAEPVHLVHLELARCRRLLPEPQPRVHEARRASEFRLIHLACVPGTWLRAAGYR